MKKKSFLLLLTMLLLVVIVSCKNTNSTVETTTSTTAEETTTTTQGSTTTTTTESTTEQTTTTEELKTPVVTPVVYHWVPGALTANVTATVDLKTATQVTVTLNDTDLEDLIDYEIVDGTLTIFGQTLATLNLVIGNYEVTVTTEFGGADFTIVVVEDITKGSSIPTQTIKGINMTTVSTYVPTEVIANAPQLMITEVGVDMGEYSYIEVFNNTTETYNLKNHRIVFSDLTKQNMLDKELFEEPLGMASAAYIYQDYEIPALQSAVIWLVASYPWVQDSKTREMSEVAGFEAHIFGDNPENLSIEKFRNLYGLTDDVLVFPARPQSALMNGTSSTVDNPFGVAPIKTGTNTFQGFNSKVANRGVQIQKFDLEKEFPVADVQGVAYYKYEVGVLNTEEEIYANGTFDRTKITVHGGRETVNVFYARKVLFNANDEIVGYVTGAEGIDAYSADKTSYLKMYEEIVTPLSTALIYGQYVENEGVYTLEKLGEYHSLEYTIPASADSTLMRYIPLAGTRSIYETELTKENPIKLLGLALEVTEINANSDLVIPVSSAYRTDYLSKGYNTIGRGISANFTVTTTEQK